MQQARCLVQKPEKQELKEEKKQSSSETAMLWYHICCAFVQEELLHISQHTVIDTVNYWPGKLLLKTHNQPFELYKPRQMQFCFLRTCTPSQFRLQLQKMEVNKLQKTALGDKFVQNLVIIWHKCSGLQVFWKFIAQCKNTGTAYSEKFSIRPDVLNIY